MGEIATDRVHAPIDPDRVAHEVASAGDRWVQADHAAKLLEKTEKIVFAQLVRDLRRGEVTLSRRDAEDAALVSETYQSHVYAMTEARREANLARVAWEAARARFEAMRTAEASRRAEMTAFGRR